MRVDQALDEGDSSLQGSGEKSVMDEAISDGWDKGTQRSDMDEAREGRVRLELNIVHQQ